MRAVAAGLAGVGVAVGLMIVVAGATGHSLVPKRRRFDVDADRALLAGVAGLVAAVAVLGLTGWPVPAIAVGLLVGFAPKLMSRSGGQRAETERIEAVASWCEMLRDTISSGAGLEQALVNAALHAPEPIYPQMRRFERRVDSDGLLVALAALSEDLAEPAADLAIVALANAARMETRDLAPLLSRLAQYVRDDVAMRRRTAAARVRLRLSVRVLIGMTVGIATVLTIFVPSLTAAYDSWQGQLWLIVVFAVFATGLAVMRRMGEFDTPERFRLRRTAIAGRRS